MSEISLNWLWKTSKKLLAGKYKFDVERQLSIEKKALYAKSTNHANYANYAKLNLYKNKNKNVNTRSVIKQPTRKIGARALALYTPWEKIVEKTITMVLDEFFEPRFLDTSHAFRPNRNTHTALKMIDRTFRGGKWIIKADLKDCFDSISHDKLMRVLSQQIKCAKTLALIRSNLKAYNGSIGMKQSIILSPILCNIFLHELDKFMKELTVKHTVGKSRRKNPVYDKIQRKIAAANKNDIETKKKWRREMWKVASKDPMDSNFRRLAYVRYADNFIICITGPRKMAIDIMEQVKYFLLSNLGLELNWNETLVTKFSDGFSFLETTITNRKIYEKPIKRMTAGPASGLLVRVTPRISFHAPIKQLIDNLVLRGYMRWSVSKNKAVPTSFRSVMNFDHHTILQFYNSVIRGILFYYSFADNRKSLGIIIHGLKMSCALTLALKFKLRTASKVFKAFGKLLTCRDSKLAIFIPNTFARIAHNKKFNPEITTTAKQAIQLSYANRLSQSSVGKSCVICGNSVVQMHHVHKISELRKRAHLDWFTFQKAAINRKQIPLCADHHLRLHRNTLSNQERQLLRLNTKAIATDKLVTN
uniref:Putative reverse transcriptase and intron maturase n=1 Tax=Jenufa minuta TaxID=993092 RepID=A0A6G7IT78_JENMI|nr:putative reverse transcriptase and intron maturase [Jenufa minuta]QII41640.1 putative reverse transcriptase and intron maturase [Jenufa minuta]